MNDKKPKISRAVPPERIGWDGVGEMTGQEIIHSFDQRVELDKNAVAHCLDLWNAFVKKDIGALEKLKNLSHSAFPFNEQLMNAEIARLKDGRVTKKIRQLVNDGLTDFSALFPKFRETEKIYGLGDTQVKRLFDQIALADDHLQ